MFAMSSSVFKWSYIIHLIFCGKLKCLREEILFQMKQNNLTPKGHGILS